MRSIRFGYRVDEAAELIGVSRETVYRAVKAGDIRSVRINNRIIIPHAALVEVFGEPGSRPAAELGAGSAA